MAFLIFPLMDETRSIIIAHIGHFNQLPVFVSNEECSLDVASIWIFSLSVEHFSIVLVVVQIHCSVKCEQNYLRCLKEK